MQRLSKVLAQAGIASRREAEKLIFSKKVFVNGKRVEKPEFRVDPQTDSIQINGFGIPKPEKKVYFMLNKPRGFICSCTKTKNQKIIFDLLPKSPFRLYPIGRLDKETTGLLLITNDGNFANEILHPSKKVPKEYLAYIKGSILPNHIDRLKKPMYIDERKVQADRVIWQKNKIKIVIHDGRKHEVRLMIQYAGLELISLKRVRIGNLVLGKLAEGEFRALTEKEILLAQNR